MRSFALRKSALLTWAKSRARALRARRGLALGHRVRCERSGAVHLEPFEVLRPAAGEILVCVELSAVSPGTERAQYNRLPGASVDPPFTPGYSGTGRVLEAGAGAGFRPGALVAGPFHHQSLESVPAARCFAVPPGLAGERVALVGLGIIALHGVRRARVAWGDRVLVLGRGILGRLAAALADLAGAGTVVLAGRRDTVAENAFDVVLDVTGNPDALPRAAAAAVASGRVVLLGSPRGKSPGFAHGPGALEIRGVHATHAGRVLGDIRTEDAASEGALFLEWLASGRLRLDGVEPETIAPEECWAFYRRLGSGAPAVGAAFFDWSRLADGERARRSTFDLPQAVVRLDPEERARRLRAGAPHRSGGWAAP